MMIKNSYKMTRVFIAVALMFLMVSSTTWPGVQAEGYVYTIPIDYKEMTNRIHHFADTYPELVKVETLGKSHDNRELWLVKLGTGDVKMHINASVHARERITGNIVLKHIEEYTKAYHAQDPHLYGYNVRQLLDQVTIYLVPMANPDGVDLTIHGIQGIHDDALRNRVNTMPRTDKSPVFSGINRWKANIRGVDLNRQFPTNWDRYHKYDPGFPSDSMHKGPHYLSENESSALYHLQLNNPFVVNASYHTQGGLIFWHKSPDWQLHNQIESLAKAVSALTGFRSHPLKDEESGFSDWVIGDLKLPSLTMEFARGKYTEASFNSIYHTARALPLLLAQNAVVYHQQSPYEVIVAQRLVKAYPLQQYAQEFVDNHLSQTEEDVRIEHRLTGLVLYEKSGNTDDSQMKQPVAPPLWSQFPQEAHETD